MITPNMKTYLALLWGISVLFSMESMSASILETSSNNSTAEPDKATKQTIDAHAIHTETHNMSPTVATEEAIVSDRNDSSNDHTSGLVAMDTVAATTSNSGPQLHHTSTVVTTTAGAAHPSHNTTISEAAQPTEDHIHQQLRTSTETTTSGTTFAAALTTVSLPQPTSTTNPDVTSKLPYTTSPANSTQPPVFIQTLSSSTASTTTTVTANPTSETSTKSTELLSTWPVSTTRTFTSTSQFPDSAESSSTTEPHTISFSTDSPIPTTNVSTTDVSTNDISATNVSTTDVSTTDVSINDVSTTDISTANASTSPAGILIPHVPSRLPVPTTKSTLATTTAPREVSKSPPSTEAQPCSTRGVVKHCLIAIASLAALATVFMVSTIILCTKLSTRKYKVKKPQPATEMMCISSLLPERNYTYTRQRNPVSNGVLVIHSGADSDEDGGDNLTLSSFLPENDRFV